MMLYLFFSSDCGFYLDCLSHLLANQIDTIGIQLDLLTSAIEIIKRDHPNNVHEQVYYVLLTWFQKTAPENRSKQLENALRDEGRDDLIGKTFSQTDYKYNGENISYLGERITEKDIMHISNKVPKNFQRMARFLNIPDNIIVRNTHDNPEKTTEQAFQVFLAGFRSGRIKNRQNICDAINYVENRELLNYMIAIWNRT